MKTCQGGFELFAYMEELDLSADNFHTPSSPQESLRSAAPVPGLGNRYSLTTDDSDGIDQKSRMALRVEMRCFDPRTDVAAQS